MTSNRCLRLRFTPQGKIAKTDLELCTEPLPTIEDGQVLVKNLLCSIDPTHRIWMNGKKAQYMDPVKFGEVMRAATNGVIVESKNADWAVGKKVNGFGGMQDYYVGIPGVSMYEICACESDDSISETYEISYGGIVIGLTAFHGVDKIIQPKEGDVIVVSGAAGAVGSIVGQLAKARGATVIGIAGGEVKCGIMKNEYNYDYAIDYKSDNISDKLKEYAPNGVNGYFDNVGGDVTEAVFENAANNCKVAICGSISEYDDEWAGIKNFNMILMRRITVTGFICTDHMDELGDARAEYNKLKAEGKFKFKEDIREGLENYVDVVNLLFSGGNMGKLMLRINSV